MPANVAMREFSISNVADRSYSEVQEGLTKRGDMVDNLSESMMQATESAGNYLQAASKSVFREAGKAGAKSFFKW